MLDAEEIETWAREAARYNVRVTYRVKGQEIPTTRTMAHSAYHRWVRDMGRNGYELVRAEQVRHDA